MLVQHCPPFLPVKVTAASQWKRWMFSRRLLVNKITSLQTHNMCTQKPNNCCKTKGKLPALPLQFNSTGRFMHTILFVCRGEEHEAYCMSGAIYQTLLQSLYWLSMSMHSKECQQRYSQRRRREVCQKWEISRIQNCRGEVEYILPSLSVATAQLLLQYMHIISCRQYVMMKGNTTVNKRNR